MLSEQLINKVISATKLYEGEVPYMYLDSKGLVTVGVGFYMPNSDDATQFAFNKPDGNGATASEIAADYAVVQQMEANRIASYYKREAGLTMTEDAINTKLAEEINSFGGELAGIYSDFDGFPDNVKQALFDMIFNLGATNLRKGWPSFNKALANADWAEAAKQSHRRAPVSEARNDYVSNLFLSV
ncbi:MAG: hypothetical protein HRT35_09995 [Algicola sp.]|nr:hypothetical protein [Algicola sp.]